MFNFSKLLSERKRKAKRGCYHFDFPLYEITVVGEKKTQKTKKSSIAFFFPEKEIRLCSEIDPVWFLAEMYPTVLCMHHIFQKFIT